MVVIMKPSNTLQLRYFWDFDKCRPAIFFQLSQKFLTLTFG